MNRNAILSKLLNKPIENMKPQLPGGPSLSLALGADTEVPQGSGPQPNADNKENRNNIPKGPLPKSKTSLYQLRLGNKTKPQSSSTMLKSVQSKHELYSTGSETNRQRCNTNEDSNALTNR